MSIPDVFLTLHLSSGDWQGLSLNLKLTDSDRLAGPSCFHLPNAGVICGKKARFETHVNSVLSNQQSIE